MPDASGTGAKGTDTAVLAIEDLHAFYGESHVLHGVGLEVRRGEVVTLLGRNGAGKTTTLRSIMGIVSKREGSIRFAGRELIGMAPHAVPRLGIGYVPEERGIFASLNVAENLMLPPVVKPGGMDVKAIHELFPNLKGRDTTQGTRLSGGEQQMLAIARILRTGADLILLDEPTEGLAPVIIQQIGVAVRALKSRGFTILMVEQNFRFAATIADRFYVMEEGRMVDHIAAADLERSMDKLHEYLGV
jgi:branched-chain amino acid transport system ATP-binding protein